MNQGPLDLQSNALPLSYIPICYFISSKRIYNPSQSVVLLSLACEENKRGHPDLNQGPLDLQSNALPLSYIPICSFISSKRICNPSQSVVILLLACKENKRGHPDLNQGPLDLQSNALPLSYIPSCCFASSKRIYNPSQSVVILSLACEENKSGHPDLNQGPLDLQSNALPLSYIPICCFTSSKRIYNPSQSVVILSLACEENKMDTRI